LHHVYKFLIQPSQAQEHHVLIRIHSSPGLEGLRHCPPMVGSASRHRRMARGGHGLPKISPGPTMPYMFALCRRATSETVIRLCQSWPAHRVGGLRPSFTPLDTPRRRPMPQGFIGFVASQAKCLVSCRLRSSGSFRVAQIVLRPSNHRRMA
jgi:hypothetical protein